MSAFRKGFGFVAGVGYSLFLLVFTGITLFSNYVFGFEPLNDFLVKWCKITWWLTVIALVLYAAAKIYFKRQPKEMSLEELRLRSEIEKNQSEAQFNYARATSTQDQNLRHNDRYTRNNGDVREDKFSRRSEVELEEAAKNGAIFPGESNGGSTSQAVGYFRQMHKKRVESTRERESGYIPPADPRGDEQMTTVLNDNVQPTVVMPNAQDAKRGYVFHED